MDLNLSPDEVVFRDEVRTFVRDHMPHEIARKVIEHKALPLLARRLRSPQPMPGATWLPDSGNTGPTRLPISFTPGT